MDTLNAKWNKHYAKGKQIEVVGYKQSTFILHKNLNIIAYNKSKLFYNSGDFVVKSFCNGNITFINDIDNSEIIVDLKSTNYFKLMYAVTCHKTQGITINQPYSK